jgi:hypothetical protein
VPDIYASDFASAPASAEATEPPLQVARFLLPRYVIRDNNQLIGFSIVSLLLPG